MHNQQLVDIQALQPQPCAVLAVNNRAILQLDTLKLCCTAQSICRGDSLQTLDHCSVQGIAIGHCSIVLLQQLPQQCCYKLAALAIGVAAALGLRHAARRALFRRGQMIRIWPYVLGCLVGLPLISMLICMTVCMVFLSV